MQVETFDIPGIFAITPKRIGDPRGYFAELFRQDRFAELVPNVTFVQENQSLSAEAGVIRGLHFQAAPHAQAKLIRVVSGAVLDVAVDIRRGSPTFGRHIARRLDAETGTELYLPPGFAHGFCTLVPATLVQYKVSAYYDAASDRGLAFDDPVLDIAWPVAAGQATLSPKDRAHPKLADLPEYFRYAG